MTCDAPTTKWAKSIITTLNCDVVATRLSRWEKEESTLERIRGSVATIASVYRNNQPWWSPALSQSLSVGVPVVTDWRLSIELGLEWGHLASRVEEMTPKERFNLAVNQKESYMKNIMSWEQTSELLLQTINLEKLSV
jgi:hypothetical protein